VDDASLAPTNNDGSADALREDAVFRRWLEQAGSSHLYPVLAQAGLARMDRLERYDYTEFILLHIP